MNNKIGEFSSQKRLGYNLLHLFWFEQMKRVKCWLFLMEIPRAMMDGLSRCCHALPAIDQ